MSFPFVTKNSHPNSETEKLSKIETQELSLNSYVGKVHVEINEKTESTPVVTFGYFVDFLKYTGHLGRWIDEFPLYYTSSNAPLRRDIIGTALLLVINGHPRFAHVTTLKTFPAPAQCRFKEYFLTPDTQYSILVSTSKKFAPMPLPLQEAKLIPSK